MVFISSTSYDVRHLLLPGLGKKICMIAKFKKLFVVEKNSCKFTKITPFKVNFCQKYQILLKVFSTKVTILFLVKSQIKKQTNKKQLI